MVEDGYGWGAFVWRWSWVFAYKMRQGWIEKEILPFKWNYGRERTFGPLEATSTLQGTLFLGFFVELLCRKGKYEFEKVPFWETKSELRRDLNFNLGSTFFSEILGGSCEEVVTITTGAIASLIIILLLMVYLNSRLNVF